MSETTRAMPVEHHSPRGLILGVCFVWGVTVGFTINFFHETESVDQPEHVETGTPAVVEKAVPSELERRRQDIPDLAEVAPAPAQASGSRQTIEDVVVEPPPAVLTPEGGLTGKTAAPLGTTGQGYSPAVGPDGSPAIAAPPPIPDLSP